MKPSARAADTRSPEPIDGTRWARPSSMRTSRCHHRSRAAPSSSARGTRATPGSVSENPASVRRTIIPQRRAVTITDTGLPGSPTMARPPGPTAPNSGLPGRWRNRWNTMVPPTSAMTSGTKS